MMGGLSGMLIKVLLLAGPILLALTVHEAGHAWVAKLRGDDSAQRAGRLSLNPIKHLDPAGTIIFFITAWLGAGIGWAKPVPVDYRRLKNPRWDVALVSAAGPLVNLLAAGLLALVLHLLVQAGVFRYWSAATETLAYLFLLGVRINVGLACFNLLPLPPLDGSGVLLGFLPPKAAQSYLRFGRYGFAILLLMVFLPSFVRGFPDLLDYLVRIPAQFISDLLLP
jgi:Zn-dependent protease